MKFDKNRVYSVANADDLQIGSECIFADTLYDLQQYVQEDSHIDELVRVRNSKENLRFEGKNWVHYVLAYLIEPPAEKKYKPFESVEEAMKAIKAHGGWISRKNTTMNWLVIKYSCLTLMTSNDIIGVETLFENYEFSDDGSPCGVPVEE
ncbi:MAG: hypothetical protein ACFNQG_06940 [Treponema socranskii subsp. buccale]